MKKFFVMTIGSIAVIGLLVWVVMLLWNTILPDLTGWNEIGYWQCAGLCLMFRLMTGHWGLSYNKEKRKRHKHGHLHEVLSRKYMIGGKDRGFEVEVRCEKKDD